MMDLHTGRLYVPHMRHEVNKKQKVGHVISTSKKEVRDRFSALKNTPWADLYKQGWRIRPCEVIADERDIWPEDYDEEGFPK